METTLFTAVCDERTTGNLKKLKQERFRLHEEQLFPHEDSPAVRLADWGDCAVFVLGGFQGLTEQSPQ